MTGIAAEAAHEAGRQGAMRARHLLWQVLGSTIDLPFNAYDHGPKLTFSDNDPQPSQFSFDLRGILRRSDAGRFGGQEAVEVFVEVIIKGLSVYKENFTNISVGPVTCGTLLIELVKLSINS